MDLSEITVRTIRPEEEPRFKALMETQHYLGAPPKIGETLFFVAVWREDWVALASFSAAALKCGAREAWIGWTPAMKDQRLSFVVNNTRFLILRRAPNLGSRVLALCERRLVQDWPARFQHAVLLLETFVAPEHFAGTVYRAMNWILVGQTRGFRRVTGGYQPGSTPKRVFLRPLVPNARQILSAPALPPQYCQGTPRIMLTAEQMKSLPDIFAEIDDPRGFHGRRYRLETLLALATAAVLCGAYGYKAMCEWIQDLSPSVLAYFRCPISKKGPRRPSTHCMRSILMKVPTEQIDAALHKWLEAQGLADTALAVDGKTLRGAINEEGHQTHVIGVCGHETKAPYAQKKTVLETEDGAEKRTNEIGAFIPLFDQIDNIEGKTITADALLTQRKLANYLLWRGANYVMIVKDNQPTMHDEIKLLYKGENRPPDFVQQTSKRVPGKKVKAKHGRWECRSIWTSTELNDYLNFPGVGQVFCIERVRCEVRKGKIISETTEYAWGVTSHTPDSADAARLLELNRGHWCIENSVHRILDDYTCWNEDKCRIRTGSAPETMNCIRRFAIGVIKMHGKAVAPTLRKLARNARMMLDYLKLTGNCRPRVTA